MDLNLYLGLPPLPRPPGRLGAAAMDCPAPADSPVPEVPELGEEPAAGSPEPEDFPPPPLPPPPPAVFSPSDTLFSTPEMPPIDPILVEWLDGVGTDSEDDLDVAGEPAESADAPSDDGLGSDSEDSEDALDAGEPAEAPDVPSDDDLGSDSDETLDAGEPDVDYDVPSSNEYYVMLPDLVIPLVPDGPATDEPAGSPAPEEEMLPLQLVDSPPEAPPMPELWGEDFSMIFGWPDSPSTDSVEALDDSELSGALFDSPSSWVGRDSPPPPPPPLPLAGLEGVRLEWVERLSHPDRAAPTAVAEMVSTRHSIGGAIEDTTPELRLQRLIQVSEHHHIVRPGPANRNQRATSPEAERLALAIQRSHSSLDASRRKNLDGDGKIAVEKDGNCGCNGSFECNICLDAAKEPVVTPCGHLFCWPCLYQWLHAHSVHSECPVCKGEVLEVNVTPIYGRGGGERDASSNDVPPRPSANRSESMRQQLQMPDPRGIASMVRRLIENQDHLRGQAAPPVGGVEVDVLPEGGTPVIRTVRRRLQRPVLAAPSPFTMRPRRHNAAPESGNQVQLPSSNSDNAATAVPQQSSSVEQASTSSTMAVIVGQAAQSRRSRPPLEPTTTRRTRRRQQH